MLFTDIFKKNNDYKRVLNAAEEKSFPIQVSGLTESARPHFYMGLFAMLKKNLIIILKNETEAAKLSDMLSFFDLTPSVFKAREYNFYNVEASSRELFKERISCLYRALDKEPGIYITSLEAISQLTVPKSKLGGSAVIIEDGKTLELSGVREKLVRLGYSHCDTVEAPGQFSIRGGILDVFSFTASHPVRAELFGDEVDSLRTFNEETQLSYEKINICEITAADEYLLNKEEREELIKKLALLAPKAENRETLEIDMDNLKNSYRGIDKYLGLIERDTFLDYFDKENTVVLFDEPQRIAEKKEALEAENGETVTSLLERGMIPKGVNPYVPLDGIIDKFLEFPVISAANILTAHNMFSTKALISASSNQIPSYYGKINLFSEDILSYLNKGYSVIIPVGQTKIENFKTLLLNYGIIASVIDEKEARLKKGVYLLKKSGKFGFCYPEEKIVLLYEHSIFGGYKKPVRAKKKGENSITSFTDLKVGDYVVHEVHGIGQYVGITQLTVENAKRDYLKIKYQGKDILYVPTDQLENINKYMGGEEAKIKLNKLGGQDFAKVKSRVKASCEELAGKLIALYAEREKTEGFQYSPDGDMQAQFEQTFPYEETSDQLTSIAEVKADMESRKPMDRLLCGDVGYGKTEVALRAAFKCVNDGKQVAYLAATTVLAQQHYNTFKQRMEDFPVNVEMLSRFRTKKQQEEIIKKLKKGKIDIVIGTHRILSNDVAFKDLGLLIVDEEQRFGVKHKEKLKEIKKNIEVLTLSATPIPRTLHMSMLGIRDMSVLSEPPQDRFPVQTYVAEYNERMIKDAIDKELSRGGQVFYLYNRVEGIETKTIKLREMCPQANIAFAHGKMGERAMENTFIKMLSGEIDVLVCTTIIETGLDISNANTIIVEDADRLGLSQLYQLRGRVGRSGRLAHCYLTFKKNKVITAESENRLKAIKEFTEFGSGFKIALRDLEIRGAGNVLGGEQHGHMDAVGYDLYMKILEEAVKEKKGEKTPDKIECRVDIKTDAFIPETYIKNHDVRMDMYKRVAKIQNDEDLSDLSDELIDRFSDPPSAVLNLLEVSLIKALAQNVGISEINDAGGVVSFSFFSPAYFKFDKISDVAAAYKGSIIVNGNEKPGFKYKASKKDSGNKLENIKNILQILK